MNHSQKHLIDPNDQDSLRFWSNKLGCTTTQLRETILSTGWLEPARIRRHLYADSFIYQPVKATRKMVSKTLDFLF